MTSKKLTRTSLSEQIYRDLRRALMDGEYRPAERLTIAGVADTYGTSSTPVREAIMRLASERALNFTAATSVAVPELTPRDLREIVAIRRDLEGRAAARVGEIATPSHIAEFEEINSRFTAAAAKDPREAAQHNRAFHFLILRRAELPFIEAICENMWTLMGPFLRSFHEEMPVRELSADDHHHFRFIAALKAGDGDAAREAMQADIEWSNKLILRQEAAGVQATE
ncbi:GntR family transcriptional regulator [Paracoccus albus]|uniref:GntR family transcriptional regulator n=1 Tax=Paracoccus albus TaxID=3017784 RepID=UPI0022F01469|nr:GntR family transcriptional regulator [Paracoccus albus]WBU62098.1 GntR family transcriptional regulator [Paracoccus albus]